MITLGIDPGTAICGYGIIEMVGNRYKAIAYGAIQTSPKLEQAERLKIIYHDLQEIIQTYQPECMGVEMLFFNKNVTTAITVGQARGVVLLSAAQQNLSICEYTPLQVKQSVVGYGKATKEQVIYMTQKLLNLPKKPHPDDVADALAIAICTANCQSSRGVWEKLL
ncbi:MAG: crossover junction endodeoxyribonuclease RuvC [Sporomusaceae bacterium]|nr:crossover junction endodeoxyribonuclease RuvC [Sporomusaceae bacterium]